MYSLTSLYVFILPVQEVTIVTYYIYKMWQDFLDIQYRVRLNGIKVQIGTGAYSYVGYGSD